MTEPTSAERFARIPFAILDDPAFADVWPDDARFAAWVRLWMVADNAWPALTPISRNIDPGALAYLVDAGFVVLSGRDLYRMGGMDAERISRPGVAGGRARAAVAARVSGRFTSTLDQHAGQHAGPAGADPRHATSLHSTSLAGASSNDADEERPRRGESLSQYHDRLTKGASCTEP